MTEGFEGPESGSSATEVIDSLELWSSTAADAFISDEFALSGSNSLLVEGEPEGGPTDVIWQFGDVYTDGIVEFSLHVFVPKGRAGYFNLQGNDNLGTSYAMEAFLYSDASFLLAVGTGQGSIFNSFDDKQLPSSYPQDRWFEFSFEANLSTNTWRVSVDGEPYAVFHSQINSLYCVNLFPVSTGSGFPVAYYDDLRFSWEPYELPEVDVAVLPIAMPAVQLESEAPDIKAWVKNMGTEPINELPISFQIGEEIFETQLTDLNLGSLDSLLISPDFDPVLSPGSNSILTSLGFPNGGGEDANEQDNLILQNIEVIVPTANRQVLVESRTSTKNPWSTRGKAILDDLQEQMGTSVNIISVHTDVDGADPMTIVAPIEGDPLNKTYDERLEIVTEDDLLPTVLVDRAIELDPYHVKEEVLRAMGQPVAAELAIEGLEGPGGETKFTVYARALASGLSEDHKLAVILTENSIVGESSDYDQANAYNSPTTPDMLGYQDLPALISAADIEYHQVARAYLGLFSGQPGSLEAAGVGSVQAYEFLTTIGPELDDDNLEVIAVLFNPDGTVNNSFSMPFEETLDNEVSWNVANEDFVGSTMQTTVFPNPMVDAGLLEISLDHASEVEVIIYDMKGTELRRWDYGLVSEQSLLPLSASGLPAGTYMVQVQSNQGVRTEKVILSK